MKFKYSSKQTWVQYPHNMTHFDSVIIGVSGENVLQTIKEWHFCLDERLKNGNKTVKRKE